uniref:ABC transporter domain-containing protein n=1 Tax=Romanomermis culicivorax TaxID=13658 RepID=A0A915HKB1_ROMCU
MAEDRFINQTIYQEIPIFGNILDFEANIIDDNLLIDGITFQPSRIFYSPINDQTKIIIDNLRWILEDDGFQNGDDEDCSRMNQSFASRRFTFEGFETAQMLEQSLVQIMLDSYPPNFYAGIIFIPNDNIDSVPKISAYELRFPNELRNIKSFDNVKNFIYSWALYRNFVDSADGYHNSSSGGIPDYFHEGFLTLQRALDYTILKSVDCSIPKVSFILKRFPYGSSYRHPFLQILPFVFPGLLMLSFSFNVQYVARTICSDKQSRINDFDQLWGRKCRVLNDISFDAHAKEITILLGKNGTGKSTLMRILTGHERNFSGKIIISNYDIITHMNDIRRIMAYDPQYMFFIDGLSVQEHLKFFSDLKTGIFDKKKSKMLLNSLRLSNKKLEFAKNLSGGQLKRLCLAISLVNDYQIAFLDEPTSGIDPSGKNELLEVIQNERNSGKSILLVTHYVDEAETLGDRIIILNDGRIACAGAKTEVKEKFGNGYKLSIDFRNSKSLNPSKNVSHLNVEVLKRELLEIVASFYNTTTFSCKPIYYSDRVKVEFLLRENIFDDFETICSASNSGNTCELSDTPIYLKSEEINENFVLFFQQLKAVSMKNFIYLYKDQFIIFIGQYFILIVTLIGCCLLNDYLMRRDAPCSARKLNLSAFRQSHFYIFIDDYIENSQILENLIKVAFEYNLSYTFVNFTDDRIDLFLLNESMRLFDFYDRNYFAIKLSNQISESGNYTVILTGYFNIRALHVTPALINLFSNLISHNLYEIQTINRPLPQATVLIYSFGQDFILVLCLLAVFNVFIIMPIKRIVDERRNGQKFLQLISGLRLKAYWSSNYLCDLLIYTLSTLLIVAIWSTMRVDLLSENGAWVHIIFVLVLFDLAVLSWTYAISFLFDSSSNAITASLAISSFMGLAPLLIVTTLNYMSTDNDWMHIFQRRFTNACSALFPQFALCQALSVYYRNKLLIKQCSCVLELRDVTVRYSNRRDAAVQNLHFKVERGEIFGLNGPNGSGKTTTYKLLTGEIFVSCGSLFVGADLIENPVPSKMSKYVGFCPQFDALIEYFSAKQCLKYFAALRGIPSGDIEEVIESLLQSTDLAAHDDLVKNLSGGKKRLLSLCVSLLGAPTLILLDEPTCGVDPTGRRKVWTILQTMKKLGCSIILTSHDMEECETLCDTMLILSNGRSIGCQTMYSWVESCAVSQNVNVVLKPEVDIDTFTTSFEMLIPNSKLKETNTLLNSASFSVLKIQNARSISSWSQLFEKLNYLRQSFDIERFSVYQPPFRDIFTAAVDQNR